MSSKDALEHETTISYADSFSDGTPRNTLAYPTKVTDPDTFETTTKYDFDFGAITSKRTPKPNETTNVPELQRPEQVFTFDSLGRLEEITNSVNAASTRFVYSTASNRVDTYQTIQQGLGEARSFEITDGHGRAVAKATDHPSGTVGSFSGQQMIYMMRLMMSLNLVQARIVYDDEPDQPDEPGEPSDPNEPTGTEIRTYTAELWFDFVIAPGLQRSFEQNPQKPLTPSEVESLRSDLTTTLDVKDCRDFTKRVLEQLKAETGRSQHGTTDMMQLFEAVKGGRGFDYQAMNDEAKAGGGLGLRASVLTQVGSGN